jgi:hypothetical protein
MRSFYLPSPVSPIEANLQFIEGQLKAGDQGATSLQSSCYRRERGHGCIDMGFSNLNFSTHRCLPSNLQLNSDSLRKALKGRSSGQLPQ